MSKRPETIGQAEHYASRSDQYRSTVLCDVCARRPAHGQQMGFSKTWKPCPHCIPLIPLFPIEALSGWRIVL